MLNVKTLTYVLIFLLAGELVVRFDQHFQPFADTSTVKTAIQLGESEELRLLASQSFPANNNDLRIMILGDSYIYGAGINPAQNFSNQLRALLKASATGNRNVHILDVSRPSNNTLDNYNTYFTYVNKFNPNFIVLAYNLNDINGHLEALRDSSGVATCLPSAAPMGKASTSRIKKVYDVLYTSALVQMVMKNTNKQLKSMGYVIPASKFGQELQSYYTNAPNWVKSKELLTEMLNDAAKRNIRFITLLMPEMDLLKKPEIFYAADTSIQNFFSSAPAVTFINGRHLFKKEDGGIYRLSRYDGHPNEKAHSLLAHHGREIIAQLEDELLSLPHDRNGTQE